MCIDRNESELIAAAQAGDRAAFGQIFAAYHDFVFSVAMKRVRNRAAAEDIAQDVFVAAMDSIGQLEDPLRFRAWLFGITWNRCLRLFRSRRWTEALLPEHMPHEPDPTEGLVACERAEELRLAISELIERDQDLLFSHYFEGLPYRCLVERFDASAVKLYRSISAARRKLRREVIRGRSTRLSALLEMADESDVMIDPAPCKRRRVRRSREERGPTRIEQINSFLADHGPAHRSEIIETIGPVSCFLTVKNFDYLPSGLWVPKGSAVASLPHGRLRRIVRKPPKDKYARKRQRHRDKGLCVVCGHDGDGYAYCFTCRKKRRNWQRLRGRRQLSRT